MAKVDAPRDGAASSRGGGGASEIQVENLAGHRLEFEKVGVVWSPTDFSRLLSAQLGAERMDGERVIDLATGSGVLAIVSAKQGAKFVLGTDFNPQAEEAMERNWKRNGLDPEHYRFVRSDRFAALEADPANLEAFDRIVCNPPTIPMDPSRDRDLRSDPMAWNEVQDADGRLVLDAALIDGPKFLKPGGVLNTIATSTENWDKTRELLDRHWSSWEVQQESLLPLDRNYDRSLPMWLKDTEVERVVLVDSVPHQRLYFLRAVK